MSLNFSFFGEPLITKDGEAVSLPFKKAEALLFFLAVVGGAPQEKIAFLLWGDKTGGGQPAQRALPAPQEFPRKYRSE